MRTVTVDSVCVENFRSFVGAHVIEFTPTPGLKLVSGANLVDTDLGANGAGKSTVFDAVSFALYGTSVKGLRHGDLRTYDSKTMAVMLLVQIDGEMVPITRLAPPERILVDRQPATQDDIDRLIGLSASRFLNSVIFGQGQPLFIDLSRPARGDLLDEVLRLEIWLEAAQRALSRHNREQADLIELKLAAERLDAALNAQPDLKELRQREAAWQADRDHRLSDLIERYERVEAEISELRPEAPPRTRETADVARQRYHERRQRISECEATQVRLETQQDRLITDLAFFRENDTCPTCGRGMAKEFCEAHLADLLKLEEEVARDIDSALTAVALARVQANDAEQEWQQAQAALTAAERHWAVTKAQIDGKRRESDDLQRQAVRTRNEKNPYTQQREQAVAERKRLTTELAKARAAEQAKAAQLTSIGYWRNGFRRCRAFCLQNVLHELAVETHNSLLALGLPGWQVQFTTGDPDAKRLGVEVEVRPPAHQAGRRFEVFSGGEGQRARLAASLGLASLVQRWAGVRFNFEVWDEPTAWLSDEGVEDLLDCLATRAEMTDRSIYLCDHRALQHAGFSETYRVTKDVQGSHWARA